MLLLLAFNTKSCGFIGCQYLSSDWSAIVSVSFIESVLFFFFNSRDACKIQVCYTVIDTSSLAVISQYSKLLGQTYN